MPGANTQELKSKVDSLQQNTESLFKLLGSSDPEQRLRFWEIMKGITSVAEFQLVESELNLMNSLVTQTTASTKTLINVAKTAGGVARGSAAS